MEGLVKGDVVIVPFPFSDLSAAKRRPALVLAALPGDDAILCQITSQNVRDESAVALRDRDFERGSLKKPSNIRPNHLFTADRALILGTAGRLKPEAIRNVIDAIVRILEGK
jgi:mRNA interferase MazF